MSQTEQSTTLSNTRHEIFAMHIAQGKSQKEAYISAGYAKVNAIANASILANRPEVTARIAELKAKYFKRLDEKFTAETDHRCDLEKEIAETGTVSRQSLILALIENARKASKMQNYGASNAALKLIGQAALGMWTEKPATAGTDTPPMLINTPRIDLDRINELLGTFHDEAPPRPLPPLKLTSRSVLVDDDSSDEDDE